MVDGRQIRDHFVAILIGFAIIFFGLSTLAEPRRVKLALNWKAEPQFGGFYEAKLTGEFARQGLDVEILEGGAGTPTVQMAAAGKVDFAVVAGDELLVSRDRGSDLIAIFATYQTSPQAIMTHAERDFKTMGDVYGSTGTLALQSGLPYALYLTQKFGKAAVKVVPYAGGTGQFEADPTHSQQCFITSEPLAMGAKGIKVKTFLVADEGFNPYTTVVVVRRQRLESEPGIVDSMVKALQKAWAAYLKNPGPTNQEMAKVNRAMDARTFERSAAAQRSLIETRGLLGSMSEDRWKALADQLYSIKVIRKPVQNVKAIFLQSEEIAAKKGEKK